MSISTNITLFFLYLSLPPANVRPNFVLITGCLQMNGAVSKVNKKCISHLTRAKRTPLAAATVPVSYVLITILQCVHPESHDTHPHGKQIHPTLGGACPL